jgi:hypothetical protein
MSYKRLKKQPFSTAVGSYGFYETKAAKSYAQFPPYLWFNSPKVSF